MLKVSTLGIALTFGLVGAAHAQTTRPGSEGGGGRIGKVCVSDYLSQPEQQDCIEKMKAAKNDAERREIRDLIREATKAREKNAAIKRDNMNIGGPQR
jgi:hypothetical protein